MVWSLFPSTIEEKLCIIASLVLRIFFRKIFFVVYIALAFHYFYNNFTSHCSYSFSSALLVHSLHVIVGLVIGALSLTNDSLMHSQTICLDSLSALTFSTLLFCLKTIPKLHKCFWKMLLLRSCFDQRSCLYICKKQQCWKSINIQ